ncbi:hypothetical protein [Virgibacillus senegalensis]|uniref:hypothetical protein n=1 Tax=Virgibacillus senegalensis TaxID=1499679 RepID=UPI000B0E51E1|nr:hypothetical protein [Virgibacillus senegalensis]
MKKVKTLFFAGLFLLLLGIYLSTLLMTHWVVIGTILAILGGLLMGGSSFFLPKPQK